MVYTFTIYWCTKIFAVARMRILDDTYTPYVWRARQHTHWNKLQQSRAASFSKRRGGKHNDMVALETPRRGKFMHKSLGVFTTSSLPRKAAWQLAQGEVSACGLDCSNAVFNTRQPGSSYANNSSSIQICRSTR